MYDVSTMLATARIHANKSQEYVAHELKVSRKTVQKWEDGTLCPNLNKVIEWFDAIGEPLYPYVMQLLHFTEFNKISVSSDVEDIRKALHVYIEEMTEERVRELMYLLYSDHGSTPCGMLDLMTAYLHLPLDRRVIIASSIIHCYHICESTNTIVGKEHIRPKTDYLLECCRDATQAVIDGKMSYINKRGEGNETKKTE